MAEGRDGTDVQQALEVTLDKLQDAGERRKRAATAQASRARLLALEIAALDENLTAAQTTAVKDLLKQCKDMLKQIASDHRNIHVLLSRFGKVIDRQYKTDITPAVPMNEDFNSPKNRLLIEESILLHFYREGLLDIADFFLNESNIQDPERGKQIKELQRVAKQLEEKNPSPALSWVYKYSNVSDYSELAFKLHRLAFRILFQEEGDAAAIYYAQKHFPRFADEHQKELQSTMCLLVYENRTLPPNYTALNNEILWYDALQSFLKGASKIMMFPAHSILESVINTGCNVIASRLDLHEKMFLNQNNRLMSSIDEFPVEMVAGYHSIFSCPILREQCTEQNPPMRLICGHVISHDALYRLTQRNRVKCPYCPKEQSPYDAKAVFFM